MHNEVAPYMRGLHQNAPNLIGVTGAVFSEKDYNDERYIESQRHRLADRVNRCDDADTLRAIEALLAQPRFRSEP